ncbi:putative membrane protein [Sorangium cellulosum So ce56]|uniref:Membrane protein n=1 Tax=Sorangium cellulosum (strain So ce56) TaxID=448385 RepID=A9GNR1_SORC5|nr:HPP family protein [Sorangium cellulosum]CAN96647.1 putative membrane protein [Sorangium cellulosum So ce56]
MSFGVASSSFLTRFQPMRTPLLASERIYAAAGGLLGLLATGLVMHACLGPTANAPLLIAPIGASTVLVFGVPASPLAQPWSVLGGNVLAAVIGVTAARVIPDPLCAGAVAVAVTIAVTSLLRCLHPPAGAVALTAVIGGPAVTSLGYHFALVPVAINSLLLVAAGMVFNNLVRRSYPHVVALPASPHGTADAPPELRVGFSPSDIDAALERLGTPLDVERDDLIALVRHVEEEAHRRLRGGVTCGEIMSRDLVTIHPDDPSALALRRLRERALRVLPVVDERGVVHGAIDVSIASAMPEAAVRDLPSIYFETAGEDTPINELFQLLSRGRVHEALIVDAKMRLRGIVTQTDLLAVIGRAQLAKGSALVG